MRYTVAILLFGLLGVLGCGYPDTSNWSKEKTIKAITSRRWEVKVAAIKNVSSDWDLSTKQQKRLINGLVQALKHKQWYVRQSAAEALGEIGSEAKKSAVPALIQLLKDDSSTVRYRAAKVLGQIGPEAKAAVPVLLPVAVKELIVEIAHQ